VPVDEEPGEMEITNLADTGSRIALDSLYRLAKRYPDNPILAESLMVLCALHDVDKPELSHWRERVIANEERIAAILSQPDRQPPALASARDTAAGTGPDTVDEDGRVRFDVAPEPETRKRVQHLEPLPQSSRKSQHVSREERKRGKGKRKQTQQDG
jgi:hypothetical protein